MELKTKKIQEQERETAVTVLNCASIHDLIASELVMLSYALCVFHIVYVSYMIFSKNFYHELECKFRSVY